MGKKFGFASAAAVASLTLVLGPAIAASADASASFTTGGALRSSAYYNAGADRVSTTDEYNDGWGSRARWELNAGGGGSVDNINGAGTTSYAWPGMGSSSKIRIKSCSVNGGVEVNCGSYSGYADI